MVRMPELNANKSITFNWRPVSGATAYIFSLYEDTRRQGRILVVRTNQLKDTRYVFRDIDKLKRGTYIWIVQPIRDGREYGSPTETSLIVDIPL